MAEKKPTSLFRKIFRFFLIIFFSLVLLVLLATGGLYLYKDKIAKEVLLNLNANFEGLIIFSDIAFNPFVQFPSVSIQLNDLDFYEHKNDTLIAYTPGKKDSSFVNILPIAQFQSLYGALDIVDLIVGDVNISKINLKNGQLNIIKYSDSSYNFNNALQSVFDEYDQEVVYDSIIDTDTVKIQSEMFLDLKKVILRDVRVAFYDSVEFDNKIVTIEKLNASIKYFPDLISIAVNIQMHLLEFGITKNIKFNNKPVKLNSNVTYNRNEKIMELAPSVLILGEAIFNFSGGFDLNNKGYMNLEIEGSDQNFGFSKIVLSETGINQFKRGDIYFNGILKGVLTDDMPEFDFSFGIKSADLHIPSVKNDITDINLEGKLISGSKSDLSQATLSVKNLSAHLPGGFLKGDCELHNFVNPEIILNWDMEADVTGFDDIFKLDFVDSLSGNIEIKDHLVGHFDPDLDWIIDTTSYTSLDCKDLSFDLPGVLYINNFSGKFSGGNDTLQLDSVSILTGNTDLIIDGEVYNLMSLILKNDRNITSELSVKSSVFDLPELFAYDPRVGENFPYQIVDIDLLVKATTSAEKLSNFSSNPEIDFYIQSLDATIQNFLPPVYISKGLFKLHEKEERVLLNFYDFEIEMVGSEIQADVEYFSPRVLPDYVKTKATIQRLIPGMILYDESMDSIPSFLNGFLNGSLICDVTLGSDTNNLDRIFIDQGNLNYETANDTINLKSLYVDAENIVYDLENNPNPFATLTTKSIIKVDELSLGILEVADVEYNIEAQIGEYVITPNQINFFGEGGQGTYILRPYTAVPSYELEYSVEQFRVEELTKSFLEDTIITGEADLKLDIKMIGDNWDSVMRNINGNIYLYGQDLTLYGLDADKLIDKLKRSQNFNLVDVGAVILAGPVGLAVTKGSDFARIIVSNPGEETFIPNLMSDWKIESGKLNMQDVAFSTDNNRIAAQGWIDFKTDSLNITIAALNDQGCSIISQDLYGELANPEMGDVKVVKSLLAPVTNLVKNAFGVKCEVFYNGEVKHPVKGKKQ